MKQYVTVCGNIREPKGGGNPFLGVMSISAAKPDDIAVHLADVAYWSLYHLRGTIGVVHYVNTGAPYRRLNVDVLL